MAEVNHKVLITCPKNSMNLFHPLLRQGFQVWAQVNISLRNFLQDELGIEQEYCDSRIQTLLLNGRPVDEIERVIIKAGDRLALSSAQPGLVGASLRCKSTFAGLRDSISSEDWEIRGISEQGLITIRLFNLIAQELDTLLLGRGIFLSLSQWVQWLKSHNLTWIFDQLSICLDGYQIKDSESLWFYRLDEMDKAERLFLKVFEQ